MLRHFCQNHIRRTKGCHGRQLMYCTKGSIFYRNSKRLLLIHFPFRCGFLFCFMCRAAAYSCENYGKSGIVRIESELGNKVFKHICLSGKLFRSRRRLFGCSGIGLNYCGNLFNAYRYLGNGICCTAGGS